MCGIIGYIGSQPAVPILLKGLERLEYRGYDSAGIAVFDGQSLQVRKARGRLSNLCQRVEDQPLSGFAGIGHTRWATHGEPSDTNAHPHLNMAGDLAIVHNGIIENYQELKEKLIASGKVFLSQTDTEVIAHLLDYYDRGDMLQTIYKALAALQGSFALGIISKRYPGKLFCARKDSPLVVGKTDQGSFIASDIPAILEYSRDFYLLDNMEIAVLTQNSIDIYNELGQRIQKDMLHVDWDVKAAEKGGYEHFMIKEIHEEPQALRETLSPNILYQDGRYSLRQEQMCLRADFAKNLKSISIVACGTAYHVGLIGKTVMEKLLRIPVNTDIASEFRYRDPIVGKDDLVIVISQSGETADTIAAMHEAQRKGAKVLALCNVVGSTIARDADFVWYTWAGPEIAVASTKAYVSQLMLIYLCALDLAQKRGVLNADALSAYLAELNSLNEKCAQILENKSRIQLFASRNYDKKSVFYIGRGLDYALAQEASLKLKEISYIHSEALAAGELKHGTIALIEDGTLLIAVATQQALMDKIKSNITECRVRGAKVLAIVEEGCHALDQVADTVWEIPHCDSLFSPILSIVPLQLFAYYIALSKGCDVDKPRNLAKSVTVE
ncbi:MAG: glutamine--fructose-6-phosphate transaminase (isomerizing) [Clostridiales bacterium]|nr:glutamine--fructose-6-phosphate transaminase (isomerizing) [Clostridiales bacterium]